MSKGDIVFWTFFSFLTVIGIFGVMGAYSADKDRLGFIDACETMGGVAIIGTHGTQACLKSDVLK